MGRPPSITGYVWWSQDRLVDGLVPGAKVTDPTLRWPSGEVPGVGLGRVRQCAQLRLYRTEWRYGHGGFTGTLMGSVSRHRTEHAACPVVVVPARPLPQPR